MTQVTPRAASPRARSGRARLRQLGAAAVMAVAIALTGCAAHPSLIPQTPAAGANVDVGEAKLRALVIIADAQGNGVISGAVLSRQDDVLTSITGVADSSDMEPSAPLTVPEATIQTPAGQLVSLTDLNLKVASPALTPGFTAQLRFVFEKGGEVIVTVPVLDASHPDFSTVKPGS